ncbi:putative glutathione S-transferase GliG-like protein [Xylariaceae sp. FL0255]|nr:putative glutathione S-transferase GliG-like protein [Xylariaceae sp. FL0255]
MENETQPTGRETELVIGDVECEGRVVFYVIKADETSYINYIKPLILARELECPHIISCIDTRDEWFRSVHPERYVPALKDQDPETGESIAVFEGTACLQYLVERFDTGGLWGGKTAAEKAKVLSWTAYQTAGLGPAAKYWLYFLRGYPTRANPVQLPRTIEKFHENVLNQWDILETRLSLPGQGYVALQDRPTVADLSYLPFAMPWMFRFFNTNVGNWPHIANWSSRMLERPAVKHILEVAPKFGHDK